MIKQITSATKVTTLALVLSFGLSYVYAWTAPTATPPGGNVSAPINTSATAQTKTGKLTVNDVIVGKSFEDADSASFFVNPLEYSSLYNLGIIGTLSIPNGAGTGKVLMSSDDLGNASWGPASGGVTSVNGQTGDVTVTTGGLVMEGYAPEPVNSTEDFYTSKVTPVTSKSCPTTWPFACTDLDTCDGDKVNQYQCAPGYGGTCYDVIADDYTTTINTEGWIVTTSEQYVQRQAICAVATAYTKLPTSNLVFYFKGNVDTTLDITLQGTTYSETNEYAHDDLTHTHKFFGSGVNSAANLTMVKLNGYCGTTSTENTITQQPSSANGYTAKINLRDVCHNAFSESEYEFYLKK